MLFAALPYMAVVVSLSGFASEGMPTSTEGRLNRNAFRAVKFQTQFGPVPSGAEAALREKITPVMDAIRIAPASWFKEVFHAEPSAGDRKRILESLQDTEIWACLGEACQGCPSSEASGCVLSAKTSGGTGVVALIHPCLLGQTCRKEMVPDLKLWIERVVTEVAFHKQALPLQGDALRKANKASTAWIARTVGSVNTLLRSCPGPYGSDGVKLLRELQAITLPNAALLKCGANYYAAVTSLAGKCKRWVGEMDPFPTKVLRCDSFCRKMLCRTPAAHTIFTVLGGSKTLLLLDGSCEGDQPLDVAGLLSEITPPSMREALQASGCLPRKKHEYTPSGDESLSRSGDGAEIQLVD
ncbi:MAG: hypothetical protein H7301_00470 [Cryobacterium sp.]|nr:hypothetical protein [Oligoflexia bacterium]